MTKFKYQVADQVVFKTVERLGVWSHLVLSQDEIRARLEVAQDETVRTTPSKATSFVMHQLSQEFVGRPWPTALEEGDEKMDEFLLAFYKAAKEKGYQFTREFQPPKGWRW